VVAHVLDEEVEGLTHPSEEEKAGRTLLCPQPPDYVAFFFGIVGAIVCVGMVTLLLWKTFTSIHDRHEFARFEAERQNMRFSSHANPIFMPATTTTMNPTFDPKS